MLFGVRKLLIYKGNTYGNYILLHYEGGDNKKLIEFDSWLKLSGLVIRHMVVKLEERPDVVENFEEEKSENEPEQKEEKKEMNEKDKGML